MGSAQVSVLGMDGSGAAVAAVAGAAVAGAAVAGAVDADARPLGATRNAKVLARVHRPLRWAEALEIPGRLFPDLPLPPTLALRVPGVAGLVRLHTGGRGRDIGGRGGARPAGEVVLDGEEWRAVVVGAEADRLWSADFAALCARKRSDPSWRIDDEVALAGAQPDLGERWTAARVLERIGAEVVAIELEAA